MMKKLLAICLVLLVGAFAFAQKPAKIAVYDDVSTIGTVPDSDTRTGNLVQEYFKSELATHSGFEIVKTALNFEILEKHGVKAGRKMTARQIAAICKEVKADYFCAMGVSRGKNGLVITIHIYQANGKETATVSKEFSDVSRADVVSIELARSVAIAIRGRNPVDDVNLYQMKQRLDELMKEKEQEESAKPAQ